MVFSNEWEAAYAAGRHQCQWPWSDVVAWTLRYIVPRHVPRPDHFRILEIGCGIGGNAPFFDSIGAEYWGIDGSPSAIEKLLDANPKFSGRVFVGDFTSMLPQPHGALFDMILDRSAMTHNRKDAIKSGLALAFERLRPGGFYLGIDWHSITSSDSWMGNAVDDHTKTSMRSDRFWGIGDVHFSDEDHLRVMLSKAGFLIDRMELKNIQVFVGEISRHAYWSFLATKPVLQSNITAAA